MTNEGSERSALDGMDFYADPAVFDIYRRHRLQPTNPNDLIEGPEFVAMVGPVRGLRILDLGCGDAAFGRALLDQGCLDFTGVDGSHNMVEAARRTLDGTRGTVQLSCIESFTTRAASLDLVVSRLALHYVDDLAAVLQHAREWLVSGGRLIFSVEHPVITSCDRGWDASGPRGSWLVDDYFHSGRRETHWMGGDVVKYHRTIAEYFGLLRDGGFRLDDLREGCPQSARFASVDEFRRRARIPLFLIVATTVQH